MSAEQRSWSMPNFEAGKFLDQQIQSRVEEGYGLNPTRNSELSKKYEGIGNIWIWISRFPNISSAEGILKIIESSEGTSKTHNQGSNVVYSSPERSKCLALSGWGDLSDKRNLEAVCKSLEDQGNCTKSAMLATMSFNLERACAALKSVESEHYALVSILQTLQFDDSQAKIKHLYQRLASQIPDIYASSILRFLAGPEEYNRILSTLTISDKVGFGCRFLSDAQLRAFLRTELENAKEHGNLDGIMISGFTADSLPIMRNYLDRTGDVQTIALLSIFAQSSFANDDLQSWASHYKEILNRLELWHARCKLEIEESEIIKKSKEKGKAMRCYYCGNSLALPDMVGVLTVNKRGDSHSSSKPNISHCPNCPNALPRCAICLIPFSSINPFFEMARAFQNPKNPSPSVKFDEWFTWCEKCHHGGHTGHILNWFTDCNECPVVGCSCTCNSLDP